MRKINPKHEHPIDNIIINTCDKIIPLCTKHNITPNAITIFRIVLAVFILYYIYYTDDIMFASISALVFYFLDGLDGHLARSTNQLSVLGDYLDHIADAILMIGTIIYIFIKDYKYKIPLIILLLASLYMTFVNFGLQQTNYKINHLKK